MRQKVNPDDWQTAVDINLKHHSIKETCKVLSVPRSTYYEHQQNHVSPQAKRRKTLSQSIKRIYFNSRRIYGAPKILKALQKEGKDASIKLVQRLMRQMGLKSITRKKWHYQQTNDIDATDYSNILAQDFRTTSPNQKWCADITYIHTKANGWCYLSSIQDLYSRKIIAHKISRHMTADLVISTFQQAFETRKTTNNLIVHTDLGSQYRSAGFEQILAQHHIRHSYSKRGCPYDNSCLESFHASLKKEEVYQHHYQDFEEANAAIFSYIESFYNSARIHSSIDYLTPNEKEKLVA
ncbi:IS3 family transposase [Oenococcus oeni]|uniref:IS3 family transposase n=1 Tax=Pediococcus parvulus TaxID=54062 RepID=UPI00345EBEC9